MTDKEVVNDLLERLELLRLEMCSCNKKRKEVENKIYELSSKIYFKRDKKLIKERKCLYEELEEIEYEKFKISSCLAKVSEKLEEFKDILDEDTLLVGEKVDLYKNIVNSQECDYKICVHGTKEVIGSIDYRDDNQAFDEDYDGNIGYIIYDEKNRNKGYVSDALRVLAEKLYKDGVKEVSFSVSRSNFASQRVAQKFGGKVDLELSDDFKIVYKCDLRNIKGIKNQKK